MSRPSSLASPSLSTDGILLFNTVFTMLVKALRFRYTGHKLPRDVLREAAPMIGELRYEDQPVGDGLAC